MSCDAVTINLWTKQSLSPWRCYLLWKTNHYFVGCYLHSHKMKWCAVCVKIRWHGKICFLLILLFETYSRQTIIESFYPMTNSNNIIAGKNFSNSNLKTIFEGFQINIYLHLVWNGDLFHPRKYAFGVIRHLACS